MENTENEVKPAEHSAPEVHNPKTCPGCQQAIQKTLKNFFTSDAELRNVADDIIRQLVSQGLSSIAVIRVARLVADSAQHFQALENEMHRNDAMTMAQTAFGSMMGGMVPPGHAEITGPQPDWVRQELAKGDKPE